MNYILFDGASRNALLPFTYTRPVADIRIGILTIREKWEKHLAYTTSTVTEEYLTEKYPMVELEENVMINASYLPTAELVMAIKGLQANMAIFSGEEPIAFFVTEDQEVDFEQYDIVQWDQELLTVKHTWDIFAKNEAAILQDFELLTSDATSQPIPSSVNVIDPEHIFIEAGAKLEFVTLNASNGPIYIGKDAEIMEGSIIRGPFALCEHATIKMGAKIYGGTTVGPHSKVGGEVSNSVIFGYSNKGHDGFIGNTVLGEWCNLGADTNTSNLKNNYAPVRLWSYETEGFAKTGLQFCGLMMGDHSKCGINTMFNTGTVVGVNAKKAFEVAKVVMARRKIEFTPQDKAILEHIFEETASWRKSYDA